jgi:hypothetical protein
MKAASEFTLLVEELAAHWTDSALELLGAAGIGRISVEMELETWRTLKKVLIQELRWRRALRFSTTVSLSMLMEQVLRQGIFLVAKRFAPGALSYEFATQVRRAVGDRRSTELEGNLYAQIVRQPSLHAAFKPPSRSDFTPRLRISSVGT